MAAPYVTAAEILAHAGVTAPSAAETDWATKCAAAIEARIQARLVDQGITIDTELEAELNVAAEQDGAALYASRKAPHGVLSVGPDGDVVRLGSSAVRALEPIFLRYAGPGIG